MRVTLEYDEISGNLLDIGNGNIISTSGIGVSFSDKAKIKPNTNETDSLVKLKDAGFNASEIMQMKREGLI